MLISLINVWFVSDDFPLGGTVGSVLRGLPIGGTVHIHW